MEESLMERTRRLLRESDQSLPEIYAALKASDSNSQITYYWLRKFSSGQVADPSVNRIEELYRYLTGHSVLANHG